MSIAPNPPALRIRPQPQPQSQSQSKPANFKTEPSSPDTSPKPIHPRTSPPAAERIQTPPTPELTFASIFNLNSNGLWEVKAPPPLDLPPYACGSSSHLSPPHTDIDSESDHGSPVVSPYANSVASSSSSSSNLSGFESVSLKSLSSEELAREHDAVETIQPPSPAFLRENNNSGAYTQGKMMWRPTHIPYRRGTGLPFAIIEEEEPPEESDGSYYSAESASFSSEEQQKQKAASGVTVVSNETKSSDGDDSKKRKRRSLGKRIKRMFVEKRNAVKLGLKV